MYLFILLSLWVVYAYFIVKFVRGQINSFLRLANKEDSTTAEKYDCFRRKDFNKWNHLEMYFCAVFLLPIRVAQFVSSVLLGAIITKILSIGVSSTRPASPGRVAITKSVLQALARSCLFAMGFYHIDYKKINISDIDPSYPKNQEDSNIKAPVVVSNHGSWLDIFIQVFCNDTPGFMAKHGVSTTPLAGDIARCIQCLFVKRDSKDGRDDVMTKLKERIQNVEKNPESVSPILIFPEGTTSNGEYLLSFKKGAFCNLTPIHVTGIKYHATRYSPGYDTIGATRGFLFLLLQISNGVTFFDMGVYNPAHLQLKGEEDWAVYAGKVKNIMAKTMDMKTSELGFSETSVYWNLFYGKTQKAE